MGRRGKDFTEEQRIAIEKVVIDNPNMPAKQIMRKINSTFMRHRPLSNSTIFRVRKYLKEGGAYVGDGRRNNRRRYKKRHKTNRGNTTIHCTVSIDDIIRMQATFTAETITLAKTVSEQVEELAIRMYQHKQMCGSSGPDSELVDLMEKINQQVDVTVNP